MSQSFTDLNLHIIFSVAGRKKVLTDAVEVALRGCLRKVLERLRSHLIELGGGRDHIHILVTIHQNVATADLLRSIKAPTSGWIRRTFPELRFPGWQKGYAAFSVSRSQMKSVQAYIRCQKEHHRHRTFEEEVRLLMERIGIEVSSDFFE